MVISFKNVIVYRFLTFSDGISHLEDTGIGFSGCTGPLDSMKTALGSSYQKASSSVNEDTNVAILCNVGIPNVQSNFLQ